MQIETLAYEADVPMSGTLYTPDRPGRAPGVIVFPDIFGPGDHSRERAVKLCELGYVAFAADLHGSGCELDVDAAMAELSQFYEAPERPCQRGAAALRTVAERADVDPARMAAIGFCYGGTLALEMARLGAPLKAVVGFHSGLATSNPDGAARVQGKVLACIGSEDPSIPPEQRAAFEAEMRAAGVDWQLHLYGGVYHTFTDWRVDRRGRPEFARYDAVADRRSWIAMRSLLDEALAGEHQD